MTVQSTPGTIEKILGDLDMYSKMDSDQERRVERLPRCSRSLQPKPPGQKMPETLTHEREVGLFLLYAQAACLTIPMHSSYCDSILGLATTAPEHVRPLLALGRAVRGHVSGLASVSVGTRVRSMLRQIAGTLTSRTHHCARVVAGKVGNYLGMYVCMYVCGKGV